MKKRRQKRISLAADNLFSLSQIYTLGYFWLFFAFCCNLKKCEKKNQNGIWMLDPSSDTEPKQNLAVTHSLNRLCYLLKVQFQRSSYKSPVTKVQLQKSSCKFSNIRRLKIELQNFLVMSSINLTIFSKEEKNI